jgi:hypothetical protein
MDKIDLFNIDVRILDIFISGPLQIYVSLFLKNIFLKILYVHNGYIKYCI